MNKILITLVSIFSFFVTSISYADVKIGGFMQSITAMGDKIDGGISEKFTRLDMGASTTTDNGWTIGGSFAMEVSSLSTGENSPYLPTYNAMYIQTDSGTITIGDSGDAVTITIPRVGALGPGAGHDGGYHAMFDGGLLASEGVRFSEAYYAMANSRITYQMPSINGFTVAASYTPDMSFNSKSGITRNQGNFSGSHGETTHVALKYEGEMDGISYVIGVGSINGNSQSVSGTNTMNDLAATTGSIQITMGSTTFGIHGYDNGESFGSSADAVKAKDNGWTIGMNHIMGNISIGGGYTVMEKVRGTRAQAAAATQTTASADAVRQDASTYIGVGYNMGGGVNSFLQLMKDEHTDGDPTNNEADPTMLIFGLSLGF
jgi:hypothetical protein